MSTHSIVGFPTDQISREMGPIGSPPIHELPFNPVFPPTPEASLSPPLSEHNISVLSPPAENPSPVVSEGSKQKAVGSEVARAKQREAARKRRENPEVRAKEREYSHKRQENPELRAKKREYDRKRSENPEVRAKKREEARKRRENPEVRAKEREYSHKRQENPELRAKKREYDRKRRDLKIQSQELEAAAKVLMAIKTLGAFPPGN